jgi:chemotaxis protein histidine kinase CheA
MPDQFRKEMSPMYRIHKLPAPLALAVGALLVFSTGAFADNSGKKGDEAQSGGAKTTQQTQPTSSHKVMATTTSTPTTSAKPGADNPSGNDPSKKDHDNGVGNNCDPGYGEGNQAKMPPDEPTPTTCGSKSQQVKQETKETKQETKQETKETTQETKETTQETKETTQETKETTQESKERTKQQNEEQTEQENEEQSEQETEEQNESETEQSEQENEEQNESETEEQNEEQNEQETEVENQAEITIVINENGQLVINNTVVVNNVITIGGVTVSVNGNSLVFNLTSNVTIHLGATTVAFSNGEVLVNGQVLTGSLTVNGMTFSLKGGVLTITFASTTPSSTTTPAPTASGTVLGEMANRTGANGNGASGGVLAETATAASAASGAVLASTGLPIAGGALGGLLVLIGVGMAAIRRRNSRP